MYSLHVTLFTPTDLLCVQLYVYIQHYVEIHILMNQSDYLLIQFSVHTLTHPLSLSLSLCDKRILRPLL